MAKLNRQTRVHDIITKEEMRVLRLEPEMPVYNTNVSPEETKRYTCPLEHYSTQQIFAQGGGCYL